MIDFDAAIREEVRGKFAEQFEGFLKIERKGGEVVRPVANIHQLRLDAAVKAAQRLGRPCRIIALKPRQKGSSTGSVGIGHVRLKAKRGRGLIAGGKHFQGQNLFRILKTYADHDELDPKACKVMDMEARYKNGSMMQRITLASGDAGRSGTYQFLAVTEAAYLAEEGVANADVVLDGLLKCVPLEPDTIIIVESTANGACYDAETEVLTDQGWKLFSDLDGSESILTKDRVNGVAYYQPQWRKQVHHHKGEMVSFQASNVSLRVTPNHSMWMAKQKGKMKMFRADSVRGKTSDYYFERKLGEWTESGLESVTIPPYRHRQGVGWRVHEAKEIPIGVWLRFLGYFLTDGHVSWRKTQKHTVLTQVKFQDEFREAASDLARHMGCNMLEYKHGRGIRLTIASAQLTHYLKDYSKPKRIPRNLLMGLSRDQCIELIESIYVGDGCLSRRQSARDKGSDYGRVYAGLDKEFSDDLQELYLKAGYGASEIVKNGNTYVASFTHENRACVKFNNPPVFEQDCDEMVYCVTLPKDHLLMVRRRGQSVWCGNSGYFFDTWQGGISLEEFDAGRQGYIRIFSAWFEFDDSRLDPATMGIESEADFTPQEEEYVADLERDQGVRLDLWQVAWMRYAIKEECRGDWDKFMQDYPKDAETAFLKSGRCFFEAAGMKHQEKLVKVRPAEYGYLSYNEAADRVTWVRTDTGQARAVRWEGPRVGCRYLISVDSASGEDQTGGDDPDSHSVLVHRAGYLQNGRWHEPAIVMRNMLVPGYKPGSLVCWWSNDVLVEEVWRMARYWQAVVVPEENHDRGLIEALKLRGDVDIYQRELFNRRENVRTKALGWQTTTRTRPMMLETLAAAIREAGSGEVGVGYEVRCPWILAQMKNFGTKPSGKLEALVGHDDDVLSLAIGCQTLDYATPWFERERDEWVPRDLREERREERRGGQWS